MSKLLVTGGAGYIGSHSIVEFVNAGHDVVCLDNYANSSSEALRRVTEITGRAFTVIEGDMRDAALLDRLFAEQAFDGVVHFAALKAVGESVAKPLAYYENNVGGTLVLLRAMEHAGVRRLVFSSSATVYGVPERLPLDEQAPLSATNPYGQTKLMVELALRDLARADRQWAIVNLRYFNPIGAHESGRIGEDPHDIPNNLFPFITQVAAGRREKLSVFGDDWPTADGTGVRDYLHVVDLARGHLRAFEFASTETGCHAINLGTGRGTSVLELVRAFEKATGRRVPYAIAPRRDGDVAECWADPSLAARQLNWRTELTVEQACADGWRWQSNNPNGYRGT